MHNRHITRKGAWKPSLSATAGVQTNEEQSLRPRARVQDRVSRLPSCESNANPKTWCSADCFLTSCGMPGMAIYYIQCGLLVTGLSVCRPRSLTGVSEPCMTLLCNATVGQLASKAAGKSLGLAERGFTAPQQTTYSHTPMRTPHSRQKKAASGPQ